MGRLVLLGGSGRGGGWVRSRFWVFLFVVVVGFWGEGGCVFGSSGFGFAGGWGVFVVFLLVPLGGVGLGFVLCCLFFFGFWWGGFYLLCFPYSASSADPS